MNDLEQLIRIRDYDRGYREHILFLCRYWQLCISDDYAGSLQHVIALNNTLHNPLSEKEVVQATKSAEKYYAAGKYSGVVIVMSSKPLILLQLKCNIYRCLLVLKNGRIGKRSVTSGLIWRI